MRKESQKNMDQKKKNFHRHFATPGLNLYWIIIAYIIVGWFYPVVGLLALICMIGPVLTSIWKGRHSMLAAMLSACLDCLA